MNDQWRPDPPPRLLRILTEREQALLDENAANRAHVILVESYELAALLRENGLR
jgi:hypothetical protein